MVFFGLLLALAACSPSEPVKLGFLGGLSGRVADLCESGRNGALLVIEEITTLAEAGKNQPLKEALLAAGPYAGLQDRWKFDRYGDAQRQTTLSVVRNARFILVE